MTELPVDLGHWLVALTPILVLLLLLIGPHLNAPQAGPVAVVVGAVGAMTFFRTPLDTLLTSVGVGVWDGVFVLLVVWSAMLLYRVTDAAGGFMALRDGIQRFSKDQLFLVLAFGWVFASFLQGVAGFGVPVAVVAPLLVALGVKPVPAVAIPLIGHAWANVFGTLGVAWLATEQVVSLEDPTATAVRSAALLWIPNLLGGFGVAWLFGRWRAVRRAWPMVLIVSVIHGGGQLAVAAVNPVLSAFLASTVALGVLYPLSRWSRFAEEIPDVGRLESMEDDQSRDDPESPMSFRWSLVPYAALTVSALLVMVVPPVQSALESVEVGPTFSATTTGYDVERHAEDGYAPLSPLTHPSVFLLVGSLVAWTAYARKGFYAEWRARADPPPIWRSVAADALPASAAILAFLVLAQVLDHSGQTEVLALGLSSAIPATMYAALSNAVGVLGAFMTSSATSSNLLFADLQQNVARSAGLPQSTILAAQHGGAGIGNAIAPATLVMGTSTAGAPGEEGSVLRLTLPWTAVAAIVIGLATLLLT